MIKLDTEPDEPFEFNEDEFNKLPILNSGIFVTAFISLRAKIVLLIRELSVDLVPPLPGSVHCHRRAGFYPGGFPQRGRG